jgi:hypothetical protein
VSCSDPDFLDRVCYNPPMSDAAKHGATTETKPGEKPKPLIHRVCIQCNGMFTVTIDNFEAKQCPNCHKG